MTFNFDMDGTLVDLYSVDHWLEKIRSGDVSPYAFAKPLVNFSAFARMVNRLRAKGHTVNIISWGSKNADTNFLVEIEKTKKEYLKKHLPSVTFDNIYVVPYGTPKSYFASGILFDDEEDNITEWDKRGYLAFYPKDIQAVCKYFE